MSVCYWSSDVCSSDLSPLPIVSVPVLVKLGLVPDWLIVKLPALRSIVPLFEIGRASCRERVEISVVAVSVKRIACGAFSVRAPLAHCNEWVERTCQVG